MNPNQKPNAGLGIPASKSDITLDWIRQALKAGGLQAAESINGIELERIGVGVGLLSHLYRCRIESSESSEVLPASVIVKIPTDNPENLRIIKRFRLYQREYDFYTRIQSLTKFPTPRVFYRDFDSATCRFVLLLQDFGGMQCIDQVDGAEAWQARLAVGRLAELHAPFWNRMAALPRGSYYNILGHQPQMLLQLAYQSNLDRTLKRYGARFSKENRLLAKRFGAMIATLGANVGLRFDSFTHGDYRIENMFFGNDCSFAVIDWQISGWNAALYDVSYFMASSVEPEIRASVEREAIADYGIALSRECNQHIDFEDLWRHYRFSMLLALVIPVMGCGALDFPNERAEQMSVRGLERTLQAMDELESGELLHSMVQATASSWLRARSMNFLYHVSRKFSRS